MLEDPAQGIVPVGREAELATEAVEQRDLLHVGAEAGVGGFQLGLGREQRIGLGLGVVAEAAAAVGQQLLGEVGIGPDRVLGGAVGLGRRQAQQGRPPRVLVCVDRHGIQQAATQPGGHAGDVPGRVGQGGRHPEAPHLRQPAFDHGVRCRVGQQDTGRPAPQVGCRRQHIAPLDLPAGRIELRRHRAPTMTRRRVMGG